VEDTCDGTSFTCPHDKTEPHAVACVDSSGDKGSCWGKACSNRNATCFDITSTIFSSSLFGGKSASESCDFSIHGKKFHVFDADSCDADFQCFKDWNVCQSSGTSVFTLPTYGALKGFPCSTPVGVNTTVENITTSGGNTTVENITTTRWTYPMAGEGELTTRPGLESKVEG